MMPAILILLYACVCVLVAVMSASQLNESSLVGLEVINFPVEEDLVNYTSRINPLVAKIPPEVIRERLESRGRNVGELIPCPYCCQD